MKPFGTRIQVKPETLESVIKSPDSHLVETGEVIAVGSGVRTIKVGQKLFFTSFGVDSIDINGERHYFLLEDDAFILATS